MKLEKAIETLERDLEDKIMPHKAGVREAEQLGIEALKYRKHLKDECIILPSSLLPGETRE